MTNLLDMSLSSFLRILSEIKDIVDECGENIVSYLKEFSPNTEFIEDTAFEELQSLDAFCDVDYMYYTDENDAPDLDGGAFGDIWIFSSSEMREYHSTLKELFESGIITKEQYDTELIEMKITLRKYIIDLQPYDYGISYEIDWDENEYGKTVLKVFLEYDFPYDFFWLYVGVVAVLESYKISLKSLNDKYLLINKKAEAA